VDSLYAEIEPHGVVEPDEQLATLPHRMRQLSVLEPDGNRITLVAPVDG